MDEIEMELTIPVTIKFEAFKAVRQTWHEPGEPAHIAIYEVILPSPEKVQADNENEIEEACWDYAQECAAENAMMEAEYRRDAREDR